MLAALLAVLALSCARRSDPPNVLLVTIDTLRADRCSSYGYPLPTTPRLDAAAARGIRFELAYAPMSLTGPSHSTMFTSQYPITHGVVRNGYRLGEEAIVLAEMLRARGYETAAVVSSFAVNSRFGLGQGFGVYHDRFDEVGTVDPRQWNGQWLGKGFDRRANRTTDHAIRWLDRHGSSAKSFFLWVHYFDPHSPYDPPEPFRSRFAPAGETSHGRPVGTYDGEVAFTDQELGRLLDHLDRSGLGEGTLLVVTSDHGEGLKQHGRMEHGYTVYEEEMRVPLVFRWPGRIPAGRTIPGPVELVDLLPTLLDLLGVHVEGALFEGVSIAEALRGGHPADPARKVFVHRQPIRKGDRRVEQFGVRHGTYKYIEGEAEEERELYDLATDPGEKQNLCGELRDKCDELRVALQVWKQSRGEAAEQEISPEDHESLKALGYVQ